MKIQISCTHSFKSISWRFWLPLCGVWSSVSARDFPNRWSTSVGFGSTVLRIHVFLYSFRINIWIIRHIKQMGRDCCRESQFMIWHLIKPYDRVCEVCLYNLFIIFGLKQAPGCGVFSFWLTNKNGVQLIFRL